MSRSTVQRVLALVAAACVLAGVSACAPGEENSSNSGPNGYTRFATLPDGSTAWHDVGEESGLTDVVVMRGVTRSVACLGNEPHVCGGTDYATGQTVVALAPAGTVRVEMSYAGAVSDMIAPQGLPADGLQPFVAQAQPIDPATLAWSFTAYDAAGAVLWQA